MNDIKEFVIDYIQREYTIPDDVDIMNLDYVESGYIDSLGLIQFIATLEDEFDISFTGEDMQSTDIRVVGKLIDLVHKRREGQSI